MALEHVAELPLAAQSLRPSEGRLHLPPAPASEAGPVKAWGEAVVMRTYLPAEPDPNPLFLEKRVYQGSSGRVYPLPVIDRIATEPIDHAWKAVHLENEYIRTMVLPEIGGRIHLGLDKRNGYDFFYRQNVIKPALVGLAGPWASGGVEFNWPQHHRPATFMPVETFIERDADGSVTVWCSDHDPMTRLKGMHGLCLRPGSTCLELRVRLYNRTLDTQTFLWWANVATHVHERYQSFFPEDVRFVADHAKRAITEFPRSEGTYYGINYANRAANGVPPQEEPARFVPDGSYPANDLSWYANIPVPTSYMVANSRGDFSGGYDHKRDAGLVHVVDHHIAPGKKQWTWGNQEFGYTWDRCLTDTDGPYIELMAGVYTDNQPDFSFLAPGETKSFTQTWYPLHDLGVPNIATKDAALHVERADRELRVRLLVTRAIPGSTLCVRLGKTDLATFARDLSPETLLCETIALASGEDPLEIVLEAGGVTLLRYAPGEIVPAEAPAIATEPALPEDVASNDELYLIGLHLEQYRHPTRQPELYWREALRRDPRDSRVNHAMGRWHLRRGEFAEAEDHLRTAVARLTERNPNPYDGEPLYNLGLTLSYRERFDEAYAAFYKATWNAAWRGPAYHRLAEIDCRRQDWSAALDHLDRSLRVNTDDLNARNLKAIALRRQGREGEARSLLEATSSLDPLDVTSRYLLNHTAPIDAQARLDLAFDLLRANLLEEVLAMLSAPLASSQGAAPLLLYVQADVLRRLGRDDASEQVYRQAAQADPSLVFPSRLDELVLLEGVIGQRPEDAQAPYFLGNLLYDRRRHVEAIALWERSAALDPTFPTVWRNLGVGLFNVRRDATRAIKAFERARRLAPADARILFEQDQLRKRTADAPALRLSALEGELALVQQRDDLSIELVSLYNTTGQAAKALGILRSRQFQPWEGGEGLVLTEYVRASLLLGRAALQDGDAERALVCFRLAEDPPRNLSEARHLLMNLSAIDYSVGLAHARMGDRDAATTSWERAASFRGDFQGMSVQAVSNATYWSALALRHLGREQEASELFNQILSFGLALEQQEPRIDYFATSLPTLLLFEEDMIARQSLRARFLQAQALAGKRDLAQSRKLLRAILAEDPSEAGAADLLRLLESEELA